jgi:DNA-binding XRE family transcriptional regulator
MFMIMPTDQFLNETELCELARRSRVASGKSRTQAARELGVARPTLIQAEDEPERSLTKLRIKMIATFSLVQR